CPVCIGLPGVLPVMNRRAFDLALKAALALNCGIAPFTKWDRKNYYYPDLPKNYQISQYDLPFSHDGWLEIQTAAGARRVGIIRVHLEEDAGKMLHDEQGGGRESLVDLNRAGTPLLEIVSQPDITSPEEAKAYLEDIRLLLRELEVSDCEMPEGSLRCDANINLHVAQPDGSFAATPRRKGEAAEYSSVRRPALVPVSVEPAPLEPSRADLRELPAALREGLQTQYGVSAYDAEVMAPQGRALVAYFEEVVAVCGHA